MVSGAVLIMISKIQHSCAHPDNDEDGGGSGSGTKLDGPWSQVNEPFLPRLIGGRTGC